LLWCARVSASAASTYVVAAHETLLEADTMNVLSQQAPHAG
jgi:hypothetical protein